MSSPPILTNIIKRGVVPVLKPIQPDRLEQKNVIQLMTDTTSNPTEQLNVDAIEQLIDSRLQQLKKDLMRDIAETMQPKP